MKKTILILLALVLTLSMAACGNQANNHLPVSTPSVQQTEAVVQTAPVETTVPVTEPEITFEELTVIDDENCFVKITGITPPKPDDPNRYILHATIENRTSDKSLFFYSGATTFNGIACAQEEGFWTEAAENLAPGENADVDIIFFIGLFRDNGLTEFTDLKSTFYVDNADDPFFSHIAQETVHIYPYGEEEAYAYVREPQSTDIVLYDGEEATILVTGFMQDGMRGYKANLYLENKTDKDLYFEVPSSFIDGNKSDALVMDEWISANHAMFNEISWHGVTKAEEIKLEFKISDDWLREIVSDTITLNP